MAKKKAAEGTVSKNASSKTKKSKNTKSKRVVLPILQHALVPEMRVLSAKEKEKLLKKLGIEEHQLPKMLAADPCALALKAKPGDVLEIKRKDPSGEYLYYRLVIE